MKPSNTSNIVLSGLLKDDTYDETFAWAIENATSIKTR